jgi:hypothetical protein
LYSIRSGSLENSNKDWLLFGFKGKWGKALLEQNWQRRPLVKEGLDIDLFTHPTIKQRLVIARNVYGDDTLLIFDHLKLFRISDPSTSLRTGFEFRICNFVPPWRY